jgi:MerR family transcriptional regulator, thiopeptide resistance regulator
MDTWSIGELAAQTGLTVRTLHHYDEIGLARPSQRSSAGHRRYTAADVRRLHRIVALRGFGFALAEIGVLLDSPGLAARELVERQLDQVKDRISRAERLRGRLEAVLLGFDAADSPSAGELVRLIEEMTAVEHAYTPEELERMAAQRREMWERLTPEEREEMGEQRRRHLESLSPEQLVELQRSRPPLPQG